MDSAVPHSPGLADAGAGISPGAGSGFPRRWPYWLAGGLALFGLAAIVALLTHTKPSYDAMGWMVWGHQVLHWNLNTDGAPSWKPLTFLFTLPYALTGHPVQLWLWTLTATAAALLASLLAGRIAYRLSPVVPGRRWAPWGAAVIAGLGVLLIAPWAQQVVITNSDPMIVTLCLAAIELHLARRPGGALACIWLAALGRPEVWAFAGLYALWCVLRVPSLRAAAVLAVLLVPAAWFVVPGLTSHSWLSPGDLALGQKTVIHGSKFLGVFSRMRWQTGLPMQIFILLSILVAAGRRDARTLRLTYRDQVTLVLAGLAVLWMLIEIAFALHGWSAVPRYLMEPVAVLLVIGGVGVGNALAYVPRPDRRWLAFAGPLLVLALCGAMVPYVKRTISQDHDIWSKAATSATRVNLLSRVIAQDGGAAAIRACGQPVSDVGFQSLLAWELDINVGNVGYKPGRSLRSGKPIVFFKPYGVTGWQVHPDHLAAGTGPRCLKLKRSI